MRSVETLLVFWLVLGAFGRVLFGPRAALGAGFAAACVGLLAIHGVWEGFRWQMAPLYGAIALGWIGAVLPRGSWGTAVEVAIPLSGAVTASALGLAMPVFRLPEPSGPYPVGTRVWHLVDEARPEPHESDTRAPRELMARLWYPATGSRPLRAYRASAETSPRKRHFALVATHGHEGDSLSARRGTYPVLLLSPAWRGTRDQNTIQAEELASQGFVVVGLDHPHGSERTVFPDGRAITTKLPPDLDFSSPEAMAESTQEFEAELAIRVADVRFVLDELERRNADDPGGFLTGRLDLERVGILGYSFGGAVAAEACRIDDRIRAAADLDGALFGEAARSGVPRPFLVLGDDTPLPTPGDLSNTTGEWHENLAFIDRSARAIRSSIEQHGGCWIVVKGSTHANFSDSPYFSPLRSLTGAGAIDARRASALVNQCLVRFFQAALGEGDLLDVAGSLPEAPELRVEAARRRDGTREGDARRP